MCIRDRVEAAKKALDDGHHGYVMSNGIPECREAVSRKLKQLYNADVDANRILIMPGGKPTMYYAIMCFGVNLELKLFILPQLFQFMSP